MMGVETIAMASTGMQAFGAVSGAAGSYQSSKASKQAYKYQQQVANNNAQLDEWRAGDSISRGQQAENQSRQRAAQLKSTQTASLAARGIDLAEGSALDILTTTDLNGDMDAAIIRNNAEREAWGYRENAKNTRANAGMLGTRAAAESPLAAGASTLLTGAGNVASSWYKYKTKT